MKLRRTYDIGKHQFDRRKQGHCHWIDVVCCPRSFGPMLTTNNGQKNQLIHVCSKLNIKSKQCHTWTTYYFIMLLPAACCLLCVNLNNHIRYYQPPLHNHIFISYKYISFIFILVFPISPIFTHLYIYVFNFYQYRLCVYVYIDHR